MPNNFAGLREEIGKIEFDLLREDQGNYFEAVIAKKHLPRLILCFESFFGRALHVSKLPSQFEKILDELGGVWPGQSLYFRCDNSDALIVLLWPWSNGACATVKIIESAIN